MLVKIQGLPFKTKYQDVKLLVRSECTITEFKLDNLVADNDGTKKVLVTVGNEAEAFCLIKCLNGFRMSNCTLSVESITTPKLADLNQSSQPAIYEPRPASNYPQARSDYPNQMGSEYRGSHTYGQPGPHSLPQRPLESMAGRNEGWNSSNVPGTQWSHNQSANSQGLPGSGFPGTPIYPQHSSIPTRVDSGSYTNRPQQSPSYGYPPKSNMPGAMSHPSSRPDMRSTDMRSNPQMNQGSSGRYPPSYQEKPITIMKDNFQGPRMYQMGGNPELYQGSSHGASQIWNQGHQSKNPGYPKSQMPYDKYDDDRRHPQVDKRLEMKSSQDLPRAGYKNYEKPRQFSPTRRILPRQGSPPIKKRITSPHPPSTREMLARRLASPERKISPMGIAVTGRMSSPTRDISPPLRRISPSGRWVPGSRAVSPPGKRITPSGRRVSPSGRRASPSGRRISPAVRRISPSGRRISPPGRKISPSGRRISPPGRRISPSGRRISPSGRRMSPPGRRISPSGRRMSPSGRRISPSGRRVSPPGRRISPSGRRISPSGRRVSPSGRGISPLGWHSSPSGRRVSPLGGRVMPPNVRVSPSGRRISPSDRRPLPERRPSPSGRRVSPQRMSARHNSPLERRMSPSDRRMGDRRGSPRRQGAQKRASPVRRLESPNGAPSRQASRYSPRRHLDNKPMDQKMDDALKNKQVRPAYESQASSQAMYSGGYRLNPKENISYPIPGIRQPEQHMSTWHQDREKNTYPPTKTQDDDRRDTNEKRHSRQSRSPVRERSVTRDQYRTNSPVSRSPRRSWALEKRPYCGSPESREVPPPPSWPGNKSREEDQYKNKFNRSEDIPKHQLVWERPQMKLEEPKPRVDEPRGSEDKLRGRGMPQQDVASYVQREPKFNPRREFEERSKEDYQRQRDMVKRSPGRGEYRDGYPSGHDERRHDEYRRLPSPQRQEPKKPDFQVIDKDLEEIYKRAQEFRKKAEQLRISGDRRRDEEHHRDSKYDSQRDRSPHRQHESDRHYDDPKYKQIELVDRGPDWSVKKPLEKGMKFMLLPYVKTKRDKAVDELLGKIMKRYKQITELRMDQQNRLAEELRLSLARVLMEMFGDKDVAFIEMVIKYEAKMSGKKEEAMVLDVLKSMPSLFRRIKRAAPELEGSSKMARYSPESAMKEERKSRWSSPIKPKALWESRTEAPHRDNFENTIPEFENYEQPKEQRPKVYRTRMVPRPADRQQHKQKFGPHIIAKPQLRANVRPKMIAKAKVPVLNKPKIKVPAKVSPKPKENEEKSTKNDDTLKEIVQESPPDETVPDNPVSEGHYELSPLLSKMLEAELQDIMIKVWQDLPDKPTNEAEKLVVNKLRNKAGDDLRNVFGLNVSQRLLNVFNLLHIKMKFNCNPEGRELTRFLMKNNITNFKWVPSMPLTYKAEVKNIKDFDRLCSEQIYTIGKIKATINPLYQFTKCPLKLRTSYHIDNATSKSVTKESQSAQTGSTTEVTQGKPDDTPTKSKETKPADAITEEKPVKDIVKAEVVPKEIPKDTVKPQINSGANKTDKKPTIVNIEKNEVKKEPVQKPIEKKEVIKETIQKPVEKKEVKKELVPKPVMKKEVKKETIPKPVEKKIVKQEPVKKPIEKKEPIKKPVDKKLKPACKNILQAGNDFDELNDDEIMALVSQGIILDECSGSDDD